MKKNIDDIVNFLYESLVSRGSIPERLRLKENVAIEELNELIEMTSKAVNYYKDKEYVPKKLAACFVDIYNQFSFREDFYSRDKINLYEDIGVKLQELAFELFE